MSSTRNLSILDKHIIGRVTPHIYAFSTGSVPSYLKVGDTYRPVTTRLAEWRQVFPDLESHFQAPATLGKRQDTYFRDHSVHKYLEAHDRTRLQPDDLDAGVYYSREFFRDATPEDVEQAIEDIWSSYEANDARYALYDTASTLPQTHTYTRADTEWTLRPNQQQAVNNFQQAVANGRTNLLMYAVMRFGKSFTSLACAKAIEAKSVVVVSAKADVLTEWKKTTEIPANFRGFRFLTSRELSNDTEAITKTINNAEVPVVFLTLQDLQGKDIKDRHKQVFCNQFDLLIVDESHYGARAESYGQVLRDSGLPAESKMNRDNELKDIVDPDEADALVKTLNANLCLHLSGTPYRILMGSEFAPEDIVAFVQFTDIVQEQEAWDREYLNKDGVNEWDNPYFGFPQMVRFAFNLNESSRTRIEQLRSQGISATLSALLEPQSVKLDTRGDRHRIFKHEAEVLELLKIIDGSQSDPNILGFLDYPKIKDGNMCRHMVMVLPYKASCDAMEALLADHAEDFRNLAEYEIVNISGLKTKKNLKDTEGVKAAIAAAEAQGRKTITLTVNKMLTGSTVEQWDTMLFFKDTSSPQEYDQAIFRLQNQYIRELGVRDGQDNATERLIRHCLKPQTLLVDFDPTRMFRMQEQKSLIYNVNTDGRGNDELENRLREELRISPIITLNCDLITEVQPTDILQAISNYNADRTITDEVMDIPVDLGLLKDADLRALIEAQAEIGNHEGLKIRPHEGEGDELDVPPVSGDDTEVRGGETGQGNTPDPDPKVQTKDEVVSLEKKIRTYYQRILFFAMLAQKPVESLGDVVETCEYGDHPRILRNLGLDPRLLKSFKQTIDPFKLRQLDYKIQNISRLVSDDNFTPVDRAERAIGKFSRISESEVRTPRHLCQDVVRGIPASELRNAIISGEAVLDIASKFGEFTLELYKHLTEHLGLHHSEVQNMIYSIPTSQIAYELTRRFYELLNLNTDLVSMTVTSYDLLQSTSEDGLDTPKVKTLIESGQLFVGDESSAHSHKGDNAGVKFAAVVGNPPYQESDGGGGAGRSASALYPSFVNLGFHTATRFVSMITPSRWFNGGKGLVHIRNTWMNDERFVKIVDFANSRDAFSEGVDIPGGINYFLWDQFHSGDCDFINISGKNIVSTMRRPLNEFPVIVRSNDAVSILHKVLDESDTFLESIVYSRKPFGLESRQAHLANGDIQLRNSRGLGPFSRADVPTGHDLINRWKVIVSKATFEHAGVPDKQGMMRVLSVAQILPPGTVCTESYLVIDAFDSEQLAQRCLKFLKTQFVRYLIAQMLASMNMSKSTFRFVPAIDFCDATLLPWDDAVVDIDRALQERFKLDDHERQAIDAFIHPME